MRRKFAGMVLAGILLAGSAPWAGAVNPDRGGVMGFIAGCCFGIRAGAAYNDGKEIHWREWIGLIIPIVPMLWNGFEGANGMTTKDYLEKYGATFY